MKNPISLLSYLFRTVLSGTIACRQLFRSFPFGTAYLAVHFIFSPPAVARSISFDDFISLGRISDPQISPGCKSVAFVVTIYDKEKNQGNSDIYLVPIGGGEAKKLTNSPKGDSHPRFSPDGRFIAFTSSRSGKSQVWLLPTFGGEARRLTDLSTGASGAVWTPNGKNVIFTSSVYPDCPDDSCNAKLLEEKEKSKVKARIITELMYRHWNHWRGERRRHLFIVSVDGGEARDLTPGDLDVPTIALGSGHDYAVSPDGKEICVVANTDSVLALSTNNDLFLISLEGGRETWGPEDRLSPEQPADFTSTAHRITNNPANDNHPVYSPDGHYIAYRAMSRPGFESDRYRLMLYERDSGRSFHIGEELEGKYDRSVRSITWSPDSRKIYVTASDGGYVSAYVVDVRSRRVKKLTEKMYVSSVRVSSDGRRIVFLKQSATMPYEVFRANRNFGHVQQISHINDEILAALEMNPLGEFSFEGSGSASVHGFLLKPPGFKEGQRYPMIFLIHGGPQGAWSNSFHWRWNYQMFASPGYVVVAINPRGSTGYGQDFTDQISQDWGGKVFEDLVKGLDYVLSEYGALIDSERIAAAGASYGGYMINWVEGHMDAFSKPFKCLVNHDGVYNLTSMYGSTEELWFPEWDMGGTPWENPEGYARFSPHTYAQHFKTPMLIIHGELDYRVPFAEAMQTYTALKRQGVPAKLLYFPDEGHWVEKPQNAELWWKTLHDWFREWLE